MPKSVSIVEARRELGRLAEEVRRTRRPVILTNRGRAVGTAVAAGLPLITPDTRIAGSGRVRVVW